ncbi:MAG: DUF1961 family protein [Oligosphaeraceae bacterium]|nr:DUF1961 family protein [Oligosphaeraceae bacterium]
MWKAIILAAGLLAASLTGAESRTMNTVAELLEYRNQSEAEYQKKHPGQEKLWGKPVRSTLPAATGKILYQDNFSDLSNWQHEGIGNLSTPEPGTMQLNCLGSKQGREGCMAFCRTDFPDHIKIEYEVKALSRRGLIIIFIAARGRNGEDMLTGLPPRSGIFADYIHNEAMRSYHLSVSRYNDKGEHTGVSNWRRNPGIFLMGQQEDACRQINTWYRIAIVKKGPLLQLSVNGEPAGGFLDPQEIPEEIPTAGKIGFRTIGSEVHMQIRNFRVTALGK